MNTALHTLREVLRALPPALRSQALNAYLAYLRVCGLRPICELKDVIGGAALRELHCWPLTPCLEGQLRVQWRARD